MRQNGITSESPITPTRCHPEFAAADEGSAFAFALQNGITSDFPIGAELPHLDWMSALACSRQSRIMPMQIDFQRDC
jgi:hypothetical protein